MHDRPPSASLYASSHCDHHSDNSIHTYGDVQTVDPVYPMPPHCPHSPTVPVAVAVAVDDVVVVVLVFVVIVTQVVVVVIVVVIVDVLCSDVLGPSAQGLPNARIACASCA